MTILLLVLLYPTVGICQGAEATNEPALQAAALKQEAVQAARQVAEAYPADPLTQALLGSAHYNIGQTDQATPHLKKCLELRPELMDGYEILARIAYDKGNPEEAIQLCQAAMKHGSATPDLLMRLGRALMDLGRSEEAIKTLSQAAKMPGTSGEVNYLLAQANMQAGNLKEAKEAFRKTTAMVPDHTQAYFGLYTASLRLGEAEEAERYRERFTQLEAVDRKSLTDRNTREESLTGLPVVRETVARTLFGAAQIYMSHKEPEKAVNLLRRAALLDPETSVYRSALESVYLQRNAAAEGIQAFADLVSAQPTNRWNYLYLGRLHARLEQFDEAEKAFGRVQELAPQAAMGPRALAELYLRFNRKIDQARIVAARAVELEPSGQNYYLLALACAKGGDRAGSLEAVKKALTLTPNDRRAQQLLQQLQKAPE